MKFVAKTDTFFGKKYVKAGTKVDSNENLAKTYPHIFETVGGVVAKPAPATKAEEAKPAEEVKTVA